MNSNPQKEDILNRYRTYISTEAVLSSWMRNTILLFMGGITVINFSKDKEKFALALILTSVGLIQAVCIIYEYNQRRKQLLSDNYNELEFNSTIEIVNIMIIVVFVLLFCFRCKRVIKEYKLKSLFK
jgi:uncharacterized membrane protein YidH (DUF202 family)|uniref:DUF202 domain-containing protein n=1 Tax=Mimiviridae sp. ChoanoV1 TaxID=2596887 RepID=A0A5B8IHF8_9VIRU|nr:hypothetical protein 2_7 [Mimiviridae sp. ChoanoV1]